MIRLINVLRVTNIICIELYTYYVDEPSILKQSANNVYVICTVHTLILSHKCRVFHLIFFLHA